MLRILLTWTKLGISPFVYYNSHQKYQYQLLAGNKRIQVVPATKKKKYICTYNYYVTSSYQSSLYWHEKLIITRDLLPRTSNLSERSEGPAYYFCLCITSQGLAFIQSERKLLHSNLTKCEGSSSPQDRPTARTPSHLFPSFSLRPLHLGPPQQLKTITTHRMMSNDH